MSSTAQQTPASPGAGCEDSSAQRRSSTVGQWAGMRCKATACPASRHAMQVSLLCGVILFGLGFFRLGFLTNLMS